MKIFQGEGTKYSDILKNLVLVHHIHACFLYHLYMVKFQCLILFFLLLYDDNVSSF